MVAKRTSAEMKLLSVLSLSLLLSCVGYKYNDGMVKWKQDIFAEDIPVAFCEVEPPPECSDNTPSCAALRIQFSKIQMARLEHCHRVLGKLSGPKVTVEPPQFSGMDPSTCDILTKEAEHHQRELAQEQARADRSAAESKLEAERTERLEEIKASSNNGVTCTATSDGTGTGSATGSQSLDARPETRVSKIIRLSGDMLFPSNKADLLEKGRTKIGEIASALKEYSGHIQVEAHTDTNPAGTPYKDNWDLSAERARTVILALVEAGVDPKKVSGRFFSEFVPIDPSSTAEARAKNRRVEIYLLE